MSSCFNRIGDSIVVTDKLVPETSVEEMHDGVLHTTNVDINGHAAENFWVKRCTLVLGIEISQEVPAWINEGVKCISIKMGLTLTFWTFSFINRHVSLQFIAFFGHSKIHFWKLYNFLFVQKGTTWITIDYRYRTSPISLSWHKPISKSIICLQRLWINFFL
jgi:hypothetical protein